MSDSPRSPDEVSLWQRIVGLGRQRTSSAFVEGDTSPARSLQWALRDGIILWLKSKIATANSTPHEDVAQSTTEQTADLEEGNVQTVETAQIEHVSDEGPQTGEVNLQLSQFTSSAFGVLPMPLPVEDVFFNVWLLSATRVVVRSIVICVSLSWVLTIWQTYVLMTLVLVVRYGLVKAGYKTVFGIPVQPIKHLLLALLSWVQKCWEHIAARFLLDNERRALFPWIWWFICLLISDMNDFRQNYMEAWRQRQEQSIRISVSDEFLMIPIPQALNDETLLRRLRMFYRMIRVGQGIPGLLLPKKLERIDCVEISIDTIILGRRIETLQLERHNGRLISLFRSPELGRYSSTIVDKIRGLPQETGLEFKQTYNLRVISMVMAAPTLGSVIFAVAWISTFVHKAGVELQSLVATAFTVASYIVTTGALIIAFVAFLDQKKAQNEDMIDRFSRVDALDQNRASNNTTHATHEASRNLTTPAPQESSIQNQPAHRYAQPCFFNYLGPERVTTICSSLFQIPRMERGVSHPKSQKKHGNSDTGQCHSVMSEILNHSTSHWS